MICFSIMVLILVVTCIIWAGPAAWCAEVTGINEKAMDAAKWGKLYVSGSPINPEIRWQTENKAIVWGIVDQTKPISRKGATVRVDGKRLIITYRSEEVKTYPGAPEEGGSIVPMELEFTIKDLPRKKYEIDIKEDF
jgi:uncharacterized iron-regulated membrane protein